MLGLVLASNAFGQRGGTGIKSNAKTTTKQPSGLVTEITFPKVRSRKAVKWETSEMDASQNKSAKPKGDNLGDTATPERKRKGRK